MRKRPRALGCPRRLLFASLAAGLAQGAAAGDVTAGLASCALGPLEAGTDEAAGVPTGMPFDARALLDVTCPYPRYLPLLPESPRLAAPAPAVAGRASQDRGGLLLAGAPPINGETAAAFPPVRREEAAPRPRADAPDEPLWGVISELRGGVLAHDVVFPSSRSLNAPNPFHHHFERGVNLNAEVVFVSPRFLHAVLSPRPRVGGSVNTAGYTSNAYADLDWRYQFALGPFVEGFLGGAVHDGKLRNANPEFAELGTRLLFHIGLEAGWRIYGRHGLSLFWEHMSNSALAHKNQGMDSTGIRYGYRFGDGGKGWR